MCPFVTLSRTPGMTRRPARGGYWHRALSRPNNFFRDKVTHGAKVGTTFSSTLHTYIIHIFLYYTYIILYYFIYLFIIILFFQFFPGITLRRFGSLLSLLHDFSLKKVQRVIVNFPPRMRRNTKNRKKPEKKYIISLQAK